MPRQIRTFSIINKRNGVELANQAEIADNIFTRFKGLLGRKVFEPGEALIITACSSVHMFFMRFPIDILFCTKDLTVIELQNHLRPWRLSKTVLSAKTVIELPSGTIERADIKLGDELKVLDRAGASDRA